MIVSVNCKPIMKKAGKNYVNYFCQLKSFNPNASSYFLFPEYFSPRYTGLIHEWGEDTHYQPIDPTWTNCGYNHITKGLIPSHFPALMELQGKGTNIPLPCKCPFTAGCSTHLAGTAASTLESQIGLVSKL